MEGRFIKIYSQGKMRKIEIWEDRATGVQYLYVKEGYGIAITPLLDKKDSLENPVPVGGLPRRN